MATLGQRHGKLLSNLVPATASHIRVRLSTFACGTLFRTSAVISHYCNWALFRSVLGSGWRPRTRKIFTLGPQNIEERLLDAGYLKKSIPHSKAQKIYLISDPVIREGTSQLRQDRRPNATECSLYLSWDRSSVLKAEPRWVIANS